MSTYPGQAAPQKKKTLTWIAIACFVIGLGLTGFFVYRIVVTAPRTPQPIEDGVVQLDKEGLTIYASVPVLAPPCQAKDSTGADVPLKGVSGSEQITVNSETWYVVARSVDRVPAGEYSISCTDAETGATYAAGPHMSVVAFVGSIFGAIGSILIFFGVGIVLLVVGAVRNRHRTRPGNTFPAGGPGQGGPGQAGPVYGGPGQGGPGQGGPVYGGPGQGAPGNYPPPGHTFPAPPPANGFPPYHPGPNPDRPQDRPQDS